METEMYCYQESAENDQRKPSGNDWMSLRDLYLENHQSNYYSKRYKSLSRTDKERLQLVSFMDQHRRSGRTLFHLTLTYKPFSDKSYRESDVNNFFKSFYLNHFLPYLLQTKHFNRSYWREFQPICLAFVDGIEPERGQQTLRYKKPHELGLAARLPALLHHHAILAAHEKTVSDLVLLEGENTFANYGFGYKIMTSDLKRCDATRLLYASKRMRQFPEFMAFPDRLK
jgi:hypothetical protein